MSATRFDTTNQPIPTTATFELSRLLVLGAVAGPILFILCWLVLGFISPGYTLFGVHIAPYSPISQPISGLGLGITAPYMNSAFVVSALLLAVGIIAFFQRITALDARTRWLGTALLLLTPLGMTIDGLYTLEFFMLHFVGFLLAVGTPIVTFVIVGRVLRRLPQWRALGTALFIASPLTLVLMVLYFATFDQNAAGANQGIAGLTQRVLVVELLSWYIVMGVTSFRRV